MQAGTELQGVRLKLAVFAWKTAAKCACMFTWLLMNIGLHKQWANRLLEPWQWMTAIVSSTEWSNFFGLRIGPLAQPEMNELAYKIHLAMLNSRPALIKEGFWHLPYVHGRCGTYDDRKMSAARCARVSYLNHDKSEPTLKSDIELCNKLMQSRPIHASPFEHQATPVPGQHGNFFGWKQQRQFIEDQYETE